eukprot:6242327-Prymnesium_polylepis.1
MARDAVPLLGRRAQDVGRLQRAHVRRGVARELLQRVAERLDKLGAPVLHPLAHEGLERRDVDCLEARVRAQEPEDGQLRRDGLAGAGGRADEDVLVRVVDGVEDLGLHRVEVREAEDGLPLGPLQRREGQRPQVEQLGVRGRGVGEDELGQRQGH